VLHELWPVHATQGEAYAWRDAYEINEGRRIAAVGYVGLDNLGTR
jgi:hypothetical protein